jgi:hypothetical protein
MENIMAKTMYEIRMDILNLANSIVVDKNYAKVQEYRDRNEANSIIQNTVGMEEYPKIDVKEVLKIAEQLSKFVFSQGV